MQCLALSTKFQAAILLLRLKTSLFSSGFRTGLFLKDRYHTSDSFVPPKHLTEGLFTTREALPNIFSLTNG